MNLFDMQFSFEAVRWLVVTAIGIYAWVIGRQSASAKEMLELRTRLTTVEVQVQQMPSQAQMHELVTKVERVAGSVEAVDSRVEPMVRSLDRIETYLLNQK